MHHAQRQASVFFWVLLVCLPLLLVPNRSVAEEVLRIHDVLSSDTTFVVHVKDLPATLLNGKKQFYDVCYRRAIDSKRLEQFFLPIDQLKATKSDEPRWFQRVANAIKKNGQEPVVAETLLELAASLGNEKGATRADEDRFTEQLSKICPQELFVAMDHQDETQVLSFGFTVNPRGFDWFPEIVSDTGGEETNVSSVHLLEIDGLFVLKFDGAVYGSSSRSYTEQVLRRLTNVDSKFRSLQDSRSFIRVFKRLKDSPGYGEFDVEVFANVDKMLRETRSNVSRFAKTGDLRDKLGNFFPVEVLGVGLKFDINANRYQYRVVMPTIQPSPEHVGRMLRSTVSLDPDRSRTIFPFAKELLFRKSSSLIEDIMTGPRGDSTGIDLAIDRYFQADFESAGKRRLYVEPREACHLKVWPCSEEVCFLDQVSESNSIIDPMSKVLFRNPTTQHPLAVTRAIQIQIGSRPNIDDIDKALNLAAQTTEHSSNPKTTNRFTFENLYETKLRPKSDASWLDCRHGVFLIRHQFPAMSPTVDFSETKKKIVEQIAKELASAKFVEFTVRDWWGTNLQYYGELKTIFVGIRPSRFNYSEYEPFTCLLGMLDLKFDQHMNEHERGSGLGSSIVEIGESLFSLVKTNSRNVAMPIVEHNQYHALSILTDETHWEFHGLVRSKDGNE